MNATTTEAGITRIAVETEASTESKRMVENAILSELPGVIFGLTTIGYIVTSLLGLA